MAPQVVDTTADTAIDKKFTGNTGFQKSGVQGMDKYLQPL